MQQRNFYDFPALIEDIDGQSQYIDREIKRTWTMLGLLVVSCALIVTFATGMN